MSEQFVRLIQRDVHIRTLAGLHEAENVFVLRESALILHNIHRPKTNDIEIRSSRLPPCNIRVQSKLVMVRVVVEM